MKTSPLKSIGQILGPHGLSGEVVIRPWNETPNWVGKIQTLYVFKKTGPVEMHIQSMKQQGQRLITKLQEVNSREEAEALTRIEIKAFEHELPLLEEDEFYTDDLVGMTVKSLDTQQDLGVVKEVYSSSAGDFLEVRSNHLPEPVLVPFQAVFVTKIEPESKTIFVQGLDSLFTAEST